LRPWSAERERTVIERGKFDHDGETKPGAGLAFVKPLAAVGDLLALFGRQARPIVVDDNAHPRRGAIAT
jgi:hypothetical protein